MQSLTNKEIAKVFALYYDQYYVFNYNAKTSNIKYKVTGDAIAGIESDPDPSRPAKLLLTPLENISDEDAIVMDSIVDKYKGDAIGYAYIYTYLITRGYSVPLYFGIAHPCNGKTPIELNIAISK